MKGVYARNEAFEADTLIDKKHQLYCLSEGKFDGDINLRTFGGLRS